MFGPTLTLPAGCGWDPGTNALICGWRILTSPITSPIREVVSTSSRLGACQVAFRDTNPATSWSNCWYGLALEVAVGVEVGVPAGAEVSG